MKKTEILEGLQNYKDRLTGEVLDAYKSRGSSFGNERFAVWRNKFSKFLDANLPGESAKLNAKLTHFALSILRGESDAQRFWREDGEICLSFIDSLIIDVKNDDYEIQSTQETIEAKSPARKVSKPSKKIFIVHGHDALAKTNTARFIEKLGYEAIILHEQASRGKTIIEKIESYTDVGFAIVIYTPDDSGNSNDEVAKGNLKGRARQNVIFEHGYLMAKLGRSHVVALVFGNIEMPSDVSGVVYITDRDWQIDVAKEMKEAGYDIDFNKLI